MNPERPDDSDLTRLIWRLGLKREPTWLEAIANGITLGMFLGTIGICIVWLGKQAGLWG